MKDETKKKYHITLTDNETGETLIDSDSSAIIGAFDTDENNTSSLYAVSGTGRILTCTIAGVLKILATVKEEEPIRYVMAEMIRRVRDTEKQEEHHD